MRCVKALEPLNLPVKDRIAAQKAAGKLSAIRSLYRFLGTPTASDDLLMVLLLAFELIKGFFLIEPLVLNKCYRIAMNNKASFKLLYEHIGTIDVGISCASLLQDPQYTICVPEIMEEGARLLSFKGACHPLIADAVKNSFRADQQHIFITGSNMSGKSTFLRTVLINSILAQTLYLCFAESYATSIFRQYSAIKIADNLFEQESYFYREMEVIREMLQQQDSAVHHLFLIDEIYKGTNTVERMALSLSVLQYMNNERDLVMASSHDLELVEQLQGAYRMYHFSETIREEKLVFDYLIREGSLQNRNAIRMAALATYPPPVIEQAMEYAKQFSEKNTFSREA